MDSESRTRVVTEGCVFELPVHDGFSDTFDVCVLRFDDAAHAVELDQLAHVKKRIELARAGRGSAEGGALVVVFIHGWHHDHTWDHERDTGDEHFREFRLLLTRLARRELERNTEHTRRVVGIYIGWNGDPPRSRFWRTPILNVFTFWNRFRIARRLGESQAMQQAFGTIVRAVKEPTPESRGRESPLIVVGHSMGALITQMCVRRLLSWEVTRDQGLGADDGLMPPVAGTMHAETRSKHCRFAFPDLVITLNSAANAWIAKEIRELLCALEMRREATDSKVRYMAPIVISATARADWITRYVWRLASWFEKTDGHSDELHTHDLRECGPAHCAPGLARRSFGQAWHCLRCPEPISHETPTFRVDLPAKPTLDSTSGNRAWQHVRYALKPRSESPGRARSPFWVFLLPCSISHGHNDIFNYRSSLLVLALMQISGAAVSLAQTWSEVFEPETAEAGGQDAGI